MTQLNLRTMPCLRTGIAALCLAVGLSASATISQASTVTFSGISYEISTTQGTVADEDTLNLMASQPWWGNSSLAVAFATAYKGGPTNRNEGPHFIYDVSNTAVTVDTSVDAYVSQIFGNGVHTFRVGVWKGSAGPYDYLDQSFTSLAGPRSFAVATRVSAVPLPASGLLLMFGVLTTTAVRRRKSSKA